MNSLRLAGRERHDATTRIQVGGAVFGTGFTVIAGPCAVEHEEQMLQTAAIVKEGGAHLLRGGAFKPRTSPYSFQGLGLEGLKLLAQAGRAYDLPVVTEVVDPRDVTWVCEYADVLQIGTRNMQNFSLLREVGKTNTPVILKRGMYSTIAEWLNCSEYILSGGNENVILCERGIRTHETYTRNTLDLSAVPALRELTHLPVITDPSHAAGKPSLIAPMAYASLAAGADGMMVEVHCSPKDALSDKEQALSKKQFLALMNNIHKMEELQVKEFLYESPLGRE